MQECSEISIWNLIFEDMWQYRQMQYSRHAFGALLISMRWKCKTNNALMHWSTCVTVYFDVARWDQIKIYCYLQFGNWSCSWFDVDTVFIKAHFSYRDISQWKCSIKGIIHNITYGKCALFWLLHCFKSTWFLCGDVTLLGNHGRPTGFGNTNHRVSTNQVITRQLWHKQSNVKGVVYGPMQVFMFVTEGK